MKAFLNKAKYYAVMTLFWIGMIAIAAVLFFLNSYRWGI
jgi:hypothetical protein